MKAAVFPVDTAIYKKVKEDEASYSVKRMLTQVGYKVEMVQALPNEKEIIRQVLTKVADGGLADVIITIGGIGCRTEDVVPEATKETIQREVPGMAEAMRLYMTRTQKRAMLTRGVVGIRKNTLIVNLPGTTKTMQECLQYVMPEIVHATEVLLGMHDIDNE